VARAGPSERTSARANSRFEIICFLVERFSEHTVAAFTSRAVQFRLFTVGVDTNTRTLDPRVALTGLRARIFAIPELRRARAATEGGFEIFMRRVQNPLNFTCAT